MIGVNDANARVNSLVSGEVDAISDVDLKTVSLLRSAPCIEIDVDDRGVLEISLIENLQRRDLNPFEEAEGLQRLGEKFLYTHEEIARKLGQPDPETAIIEMPSLPTRFSDFCPF